jgi:hypothetical protein
MRSKLIETWGYFLKASKNTNSQKMRSKYLDMAYGAGVLYSMTYPDKDLTAEWNPYRMKFLGLIAEATET